MVAALERGPCGDLEERVLAKEEIAYSFRTLKGPRCKQTSRERLVDRRGEKNTRSTGGATRGAKVVTSAKKSRAEAEDHREKQKTACRPPRAPDRPSEKAPFTSGARSREGISLNTQRKRESLAVEPVTGQTAAFSL